MTFRRGAKEKLARILAVDLARRTKCYQPDAPIVTTLEKGLAKMTYAELENLRLFISLAFETNVGGAHVYPSPSLEELDDDRNARDVKRYHAAKFVELVTEEHPVFHKEHEKIVALENALVTMMKDDEIDLLLELAKYTTDVFDMPEDYL